MPFRMPARTSACRIGSRCRGGRVLRAANALAETGRPWAWSATSTTAVMARRPLRDNSDMRTTRIWTSPVVYYGKVPVHTEALRIRDNPYSGLPEDIQNEDN